MGFSPVDESSFTRDTLVLIKEDVDESIGFIRIRESKGTGFRVGKTLFMTTYHVLKDEIGEQFEFHFHFKPSLMMN